MRHENENTANSDMGLKRREFMAILAGCTGGIMVPGLLQGDGETAASDRLGKLLPLRKLGSSGPAVTNLGVGGNHIGLASEKDAQAIIETALEEGVRFFDNAVVYSSGRAEERFGRFLTPKYRDVSFIMTKSMAKDGKAALKELDASLSRMKTDYVDLWQV
ncbi:MAG: aldo/keto reductase, partial [Planctomycetes bacterium]|nr:aldo/keto reductase [Planctomycetota bacterium]